MRERFSTTDTESFSRIRAKGAPRRGRRSERFDDHEPEVVFGFDDHGAYAVAGDEYADFDGGHENHDGEHDHHDDSHDDNYDGPAGADRWSTWDQSTPTEKGPEPRPAWVVTELAAVDTELGLVKTGKEADVFLLERAVPGTDRRTLMAAKRYRDSQHRMFHRDSGYLEGRRHKESRIARAMAKRTAFGKEAIAAQWAGAEFTALSPALVGRGGRPLPGADHGHGDPDGVRRRRERHRRAPARAAAGGGGGRRGPVGAARPQPVAAGR